MQNRRKEPPQKLIDELTKKLVDKRFSDAVVIAKSMQKTFPNSITVLNLLGAALAQSKQYDEALNTFKLLITRLPENAGLNYNLANIYREQGNFDKAIEFYEKAISIDPSHSGANNNLHLALLQNHKNLETIFETNKNDPIINFKLGVSHKKLDNLEEAIRCLRVSIHKDNQNSEAHYEMGIIYQVLGRHTEAIQAYKNALLISPNLNDAHHNIGILHQTAGNFDSAIKHFKSALKLNRNNHEVYLNMGSCYKSANQIEKAIKCLKQAIKLKSKYEKAHYNLGVIYIELKKFNEAEKSLRKALLIRNNYTEARLALGQVLNARKAFDEEGKCYVDAINNDPKNYVGYYALAKHYFKNEQFQDALEVCNSALAIQPNLLKINFLKVNLLLELQNFELAEQIMQSLEPQKFQTAEIYTLYADLLASQEKINEAFEYYETALKLDSSNAMAHINFGRFLRRAGRLNESIKYLQRAVELSPESSAAHSNLSFSYLAQGKVSEAIPHRNWRWDSLKGQPAELCYRKPIWTGDQDLKNKTLLVWSEQGPGDVINWTSAFEPLVSQNCKIILECHEKLVDLLQASFPRIEVRPHPINISLARSDFDYHVPIESLAAYQIINDGPNRCHPARIKPLPEKVKYYRDRLSNLTSKLCVGISWKSPKVSSNRIGNYTNLEDWTNVFQNKNITLVNLQSTDFSSDLDRMKREFGAEVHHFDEIDHYNDIHEVAALISALDLTVSIVTLVSDLSAAVGTETLIPTWRQSAWNNPLFEAKGPNIYRYYRNTGDTWKAAFQGIEKHIDTKLSSMPAY